jgi:hypothetical protein
MSEAIFSHPPYSTLKNEFIKTLEKSIEDNQDIKLSVFADDVSILTHRAKIIGWKQSLDTFKKLVSFIENPQNVQTNPVPIPPSSPPLVTDGEIVE